jgi:hypothetical protein
MSSEMKGKAWRLVGRDLEFLIDTVSPGVGDKPALKQIIRTDEDFRNTFIGNAKVFKRVMGNDEILLKISKKQKNR